MPILLAFFPSPRKGKRYRMVFADPHKIVDFGSKHSNTYVDNATDITRTNYLNRHRVNEDWSKINPGSASALILWGENKGIEDNLIQYIDKFKIRVPKGSSIIY